MWNSLKCPSRDEQIKKMGYVDKMVYYLAFKKRLNPVISTI
jgi:hypothetical protein